MTGRPERRPVRLIELIHGYPESEEDEDRREAVRRAARDLGYLRMTGHNDRFEYAFDHSLNVGPMVAAIAAHWLPWWQMSVRTGYLPPGPTVSLIGFVPLSSVSVVIDDDRPPEQEDLPW